ncbi:AAA family ATPase [Myroides odoratimimus]|uniref:nuclease-related domain-containing DEAD/DEAH box helicase n=1 Tax=Myroides odoratimimus TaxID=76832 RepID=UPI002578CCA8|nr:UvrD-helicase domain-containing protein [Myroides odoratimimus]MDM1412420.1 AAA family ATPase [Myroides odoratimimus]
MIYPSSIKQEAPNSEKQLFKALSRLNSNDFTVFYNQEFVGEYNSKERMQYEIDFIIVDHRYDTLESILVLEVKGGNLQYDAYNDKWSQSGREMPMSPITQVTTAMYSFLNRFKNILNDVNVSWGLAFPDVEIDYDTDLPTNLNRIKIFDCNDIDNIEERLIEYFDQTKLEINRSGADLKNFSLLKERLLVNCDFVKPLHRSIKENNEVFIKLTKLQSLVVRALEANQNVIVQGPAGSGKTLIAYEKALQYKEQGKRVLYLTFNKEIATHLRDKYRSNNIALNDLDSQGELEITNFHFWCKSIAERNESFAKQKSEDEYFNTYIPNKALEVIKSDTTYAMYDVVIIDEGQDFRENWLNLVNKVLKQEGKFLLFMDENQDIFNAFKGVPNRRNIVKTQLEENCRNTRNIIEFLKGLLSIDISYFEDSPEGEKVEVKASSSNQEQIEYLDALITKLVTKDKVMPKDILILVNNIDKVNALKDVKTVGGITLKSSYDRSFGRDQESIFYSYINTFKGLESEVVIILDSQNIEGAKSFYTQASRAKNKLFISVVKHL